MITEITEQALTKKIADLSVPSRLGAKTALGPIQALLERLGQPQCDFPAIHIGGTSGKGSTSTFLASILSAAGYKVGLFTKPHLFSVRERFVINGTPIAPEEMLLLLEKVEAVVGDDKPTWFELTTALAFLYFAEQQVDFGVIEVGLGGACDATNVIQPQVSILTNVGLDHTDILGDTVEKIASDKVGIFKPARPVISGVEQPSVIEIVETRSRALDCPLRLLGRDFTYSSIHLTSEGSTFDFRMGSTQLSGLSITMPGQHQVANASVATAAALALRDLGCHIAYDAIRDGLALTQVPGRMEIIQHSPVILLDGAHSPPKMAALSQGLHSLFANKERIIGVLSFSKGHDASASLSTLAPMLHTAVLTEFSAETDYGNKRAQDIQDLAVALKALNPAIQIFLQADPIQAIQMASDFAGPNDLICVTGSIFLVGQVRAFLNPSMD